VSRWTRHREAVQAATSVVKRSIGLRRRYNAVGWHRLLESNGPIATGVRWPSAGLGHTAAAAAVQNFDPVAIRKTFTVSAICINYVMCNLLLPYNDVWMIIDI